MKRLIALLLALLVLFSLAACGRGGTEDEKQHQAGGKTQPVPQEKNSGNGRQTGKPREERGGDSPTQKDAGHEQQAGRG